VTAHAKWERAVALYGRLVVRLSTCADHERESLETACRISADEVRLAELAMTGDAILSATRGQA
jgi:hypothetical protein